MTPEDAKEKWCPMARVSIRTSKGYTSAANRIVNDAKDYMKRGVIGLEACVADKCACWRWYDAPKGHGECDLTNRP